MVSENKQEMLSLKGRFPFRLGTTSFIYPADYATNVERLGTYVDEIELLLFESRPGSLPSAAEVDRLAGLAKESDISYNVHLPLDVFLGSPDPEIRRETVQSLVRVYERIQSLNPTSYTLHLTFEETDREHDNIRAWQKRCMLGLTDLLATVAIPPKQVAIETLDYPHQWWLPMVEDLNLGVCLDVGHIIRYGFDLQEALADFAGRTQIIHLHGVADGHDHLALPKLDILHRQIILPYLKTFTGSVSLELFSAQKLRDSLVCLSELML